MSTTASQQHTRARVLQLHRPDINATVNNFMIMPSETHAMVLAHIKAVLPGKKLKEVWPCDVNGEPLFDLEDKVSSVTNVAHGERVLVALEPGQRIRPEPKLQVVVYPEDDTLPKPLRKMAREARRIHMRTLRRRDAPQRDNILRLNLPHSNIMTALYELDTATAQKMRTNHSLNTSKRIIRENWQVKTDSKGTQKCLAALAILSSATCGQPLVPEDALHDAIEARGKDETEAGLQEADVRAVIKEFYEAANAIGSKWLDNQDNKTIAVHSKRKREYTPVEGKKGQNERDAAAVEQLGEEAAEAAHPRTKTMREVDDLARRLEKATVPDVEMPESGSDEEDEDYQVRKPGRFKRARLSS